MKGNNELSRLAARFCQQPKFRAFCKVDTEAQAREFILSACGIESRRELDHNAGAAQMFHRVVRLPFVAWQEQSPNA